MTAPTTTRPPGAAPAGPDGVVVLGDGTTVRSRAGARWRRVRWLVGVAVVLGIGVLAALLPAPTRSATALAPDNPRDNGAMALAEVLRDQGVRIDYVRSVGAATDAAEAGRTLLVTSDWLLSDAQTSALAGTDADLVLLDPSFLLDRVVPGLTTGWSGGTGPAPLAASCPDPDATAAGTVSATGAGVVPTGEAVPDGTTLCFPVPGTSPQASLYSVSEVDGRRVTVLGDAGLITNARITDEGNAALALRALGRNAELVWYVPSADDLGADGTSTGPGLGDLLPPVARVLLIQALVVVVALGLWRGRRLGRVVAERLPVVVRPAETTRGRARLYRTSRSYGHAAASLRAGTAARLARRLGVPRSAAAPDVVVAVARAAGRDEVDVRDLLYGPPPTSDAGLEHLARRLDQLESEVHPT
jgi:hypothetical protein